MPPDLDPEEGTPADEADVESKSDALESAIWRLTAGKGDRGSGALRRGTGSGEVPSAATAGEPTSERKTAAGRVDFVLQVGLHVYCNAACLLSGCMSTAVLHDYYQAAHLLQCCMTTTRLHIYCNAACLLPGCMSPAASGIAVSK